jgi:RNA polymerase sigma factor (sigma-70 family)
MNITELYRAARHGDKDAEQRLFDYLSVSFRSFARLRGMDENDTDDVVQTTLLKIAETYCQTDIHTSFAGWAHAVLRNHMIEHFRSRNLDRRKTAEFALRQNPTHSAGSCLRLKAELNQCLKDIHGRNPTYARVLTLHFQGYTTAEICDKLSITSSNLYTILSRARVSLRECLKRKGVLGV